MKGALAQRARFENTLRIARQPGAETALAVEIILPKGVDEGPAGPSRQARQLPRRYVGVQPDLDQQSLVAREVGGQVGLGAQVPLALA